MPAFVCREQAVAAVTTALAQPSALVLVEGEAGIGKTRLMQECIKSDALADRIVLQVACPPVAESFPLGPVIDGLRRLRESIAGVELSPLGGALRPLFPEWAAILPPLPEPLEDAAATRHRFFRALDELINRLQVDIVEVEDAHWADPATLEWLLRSAGSGDHPRSVVVTYRQHDAPAGSLLWRLAARSTPGKVRADITLEPLDVPGIQALVGSMFGGQEVSTEFALFLLERTGGLPLAVEECLKLLRERGDIERRGDEWARRALAEIEVPPTVRESVLERFRRLDHDTQQVLKAAAVFGEPEQDAMLATVAELETPAARSALNAACRAGLLGGDGMGGVSFRHQLAAEAVEESIPDAERRRMHQLAGNALQTTKDPSVARLVRHFKAAADFKSWVRYAEATADLALESGDDRAAATLLLDLLTTADLPTQRRAAVARKLGQTTAKRSESFGELETAVRHALQTVLADEALTRVDHGEIRLLLGWLLLQADDKAAYAEIETAFADLRDRPALAARAALLLALPRGTLVWPAARHREWLKKANRLLPKLSSPTDRLALIIDRAHILLRLGDDSGWRAAAEIPRSVSTLAERQQLARGLVNLALCAMSWGRYASARQWLTDAELLARETGFHRVLVYTKPGQALLDYYMGAWAGLDEIVQKLADSQEHERFQLDARLIHALLSLARSGRTEAERRLQEVSRLAAAGSQTNSAAILSAAALGRLFLADGGVQDAVRITKPSMDVIAEKGTWLWATGIAPVHIDALVSAGDLTRAQTLVAMLSADVANRTAPAPTAALLTCRAILAESRGDKETSAGLFAQAAEAWAGLPRPYDELLTRERQGRCLLATNGADKALTVLSETIERMHGLGARWDADRVARLLRGHGMVVPRYWRSGPRGYGDQLSPREREVIALVARGMTNRDVGEALFLSPKTVSRHLSTAMRKLRVSTRTGAAMAAAEAGLVAAPADAPVD